jgi:hypothetical protein
MPESNNLLKTASQLAMKRLTPLWARNPEVWIIPEPRDTVSPAGNHHRLLWASTYAIEAGGVIFSLMQIRDHLKQVSFFSEGNFVGVVTRGEPGIVLGIVGFTLCLISSGLTTKIITRNN